MTQAYDWRTAPPGDFAVIGDPIGHSWSPALHQAAYQELAMDLVYRAIQVPESDFGEAVASLTRMGYRGLNVTLPLKELAFRWADQMDPESHRLRALNTVSLESRAGTNTDVPAFLSCLASFGIQPPSKALVIGAGGSARAIAIALARAGFQLSIFNRTASRAEELIEESEIAAEILEAPSAIGFQLIVNATSAGISGSPLDVIWGPPNPDALAFDLMYGSEPTPFLRDADLAGFMTSDGKEMLVEQAALSFEWWLESKAPREAMRRAAGL